MGSPKVPAGNAIKKNTLITCQILHRCSAGAPMVPASVCLLGVKNSLSNPKY